MIENELALLKGENENQALKLRYEDWQTIKSIMKSMSIFKVNSYDRLVIQRDLIGMAQELELRDSSIQEEIGDDVKGFANEIILNSNGPCIREIRLKFFERLFLYFFVFFAVIALVGYGDDIWRANPINLYLYYTAFVAFGFILEQIIEPLYATDKVISKILPAIISISVFGFMFRFVLPIILSLNQYTQHTKEGKFGPEVIPTIVISAIGLFATKHLKAKNIHRLAQDKKNYIEDLK